MVDGWKPKLPRRLPEHPKPKIRRVSREIMGDYIALHGLCCPTAERMGIPWDEIWIRADISMNRPFYIATKTHELWEWWMMFRTGVSYRRAHRAAIKAERNVLRVLSRNAHRRRGARRK